MSVKIYNTLSKKKENFSPAKDKNVKLFVCGITPYDYAHIGHAKTYVQFDVIVKYLKFKGYKVFYLQNITDVDDKIIKRASDIKVSPIKLAEKFENYYLEDMKKLHVNSIDKFARATDHIKEIQAQVSRLMDKGFAYSVEEDGIYFDLSKDKDYGKLSGRKYQEAEDAVSRIDDGGNKRNKGDFCLWKKSKKNEPSWQDPWFNGGRPGWHIEDTAISEKYLGEQYDIHGGARDLIFPHHEAEIAQQESASGKKPFVRYWMHTGFLNVKGQKMAKSLSNFITIRDALSKYDAKVLRFFFISGHYRSPIDFSEELLKQAKNGLDRLNEFLIKAKNGNKDDIDLIEKSRKKFIYNMDDDFDTVKALASIFDFVKDANKKGAGKKSYKFMKEIDTIFNVFDDGDIKIPSRVEKLVEDREIARNAKNFKRADELRQIIKKEGYVLDDTAKGTLIKKV